MAAAKKLEPDSQWAHLDRDGDGIVTDEEIAMEERMIELADMRSDMENEDKKQDAQRNKAMVLNHWPSMEITAAIHKRRKALFSRTSCKYVREAIILPPGGRIHRLIRCTQSTLMSVC